MAAILFLTAPDVYTHCMNKTICILLCSCVLVTISRDALAVSPQPQADDDHLIAANGRIDRAYEKLLNRRLFVTPANYARIVTLASPASLGEFAIAIYSKKGNDPDDVWITSTRAERNLWAAEFGGDPNFPKKPTIKIARRDFSFPKSTAVTVSNAIKRMLDASRPLSQSGRIVVGATKIEFSVENQEGKPVRALLTPDTQGKKTAALRRLTQLLEEYCEGPPAGQSALEKKIGAEARRLEK